MKSVEITVTVEQASQRLAELILQAAAGEEIVIVQQDKPAARLVPVRSAAGPRRFGAYGGMIEIHDDFDEPLPAEFWLGEIG
jgi:prevent-host-death family protein